jgi:hypothetical protein
VMDFASEVVCHAWALFSSLWVLWRLVREW